MQDFNELLDLFLAQAGHSLTTEQRALMDQYTDELTESFEIIGSHIGKVLREGRLAARIMKRFVEEYEELG